MTKKKDYGSVSVFPLQKKANLNSKSVKGLKLMRWVLFFGSLRRFHTQFSAKNTEDDAARIVEVVRHLHH